MSRMNARKKSNKRIPSSLKELSKKERRLLEKHSSRWEKRLEPLRDSIDASERITAEDLAITIGPCPLKLPK